MGIIKEPTDFDFVVESGPLTLEEKQRIEKYIEKYKAGEGADLQLPVDSGIKENNWAKKGFRNKAE